MRSLLFSAFLGTTLVITGAATAQAPAPSNMGRPAAPAIGTAPTTAPMFQGPAVPPTWLRPFYSPRFYSMYNYNMYPSYPSMGYGSQNSMEDEDGQGSYADRHPEGARGGYGTKETELPHPTGDIRVAPADAGVIRLRVPDRFAEILFNGKNISSIGTTRTFVTPNLPPGETDHYKIKVTWGRGNQRRSLEQAVEVRPGQVATLDMTRPAKGAEGY